MNPICILHVVRAGRAEGGMENGIVNLANRMDGRFAVSVCALDFEENFSTRIHRPGSRFFCVPVRRQGIDWSLIPRLASLIRRECIDIVHSHNWGTFLYSVLAGRLARVAVVHGEHGKHIAELTAEGSAKRLAKKWLGGRAHQILSVCDDIRNEWVAGYAIDERRIRTIRNGVDVERFAPAPPDQARSALGLENGWFVAGTVGRLDPIKNCPLMIDATARAAREIPSFHAVFIGGGPVEAELRQRTAALSLEDRVHFAGLRSDVHQLLPAFDLFILPSFSEGMSNVLLEAMASGVPPVCADLASHREIVTPGHDSVLLQPCDAATLSEAIRNLYDNPEVRARLAVNARRTILHGFTLEHMVRSYQDTYLEVQSGRTGH